MARGREGDWLDRIQVAAPCSERWETMRGDARARHCERYALTVFNLSEMTRPEAELLVAGTSGRVCVRFYRRADGTVLTTDCPVGLARRVSRRVRRSLAAAAAILCAMIGCGAQRDATRGSDRGALMLGSPLAPSDPPSALESPAGNPPSTGESK